MLPLNPKHLLENHWGLHLNRIYPLNLLLLADFEKVPCQCRQHLFNFPPIILQYSSTHFKDRWIFFSLIKKNIVGEKTLDVISKNVKICQTQIPLKGFIN